MSVYEAACCGAASPRAPTLGSPPRANTQRAQVNSPLQFQPLILFHLRSITAGARHAVQFCAFIKRLLRRLCIFGLALPSL
jgi:hypothetical protein